jgi:hypothetical protein
MCDMHSSGGFSTTVYPHLASAAMLFRPTASINGSRRKEKEVRQAAISFEITQQRAESDWGFCVLDLEFLNSPD